MIGFLWMLFCIVFSWGGRAQAAPPATTATTTAAVEVVPAPQETPNTITLMMMIEQGGAILWVIMGLAFIAIALALYLLITVSPRREAPQKIAKRARAQVLAGEFEGARQMCLEGDELLARVLAAGLKFVGHDRYIIQEAMESEGERGATALWQRITYLNNIASIAPLLGLLGTVWGMMRAFSAIALDTAQVKGISMAYSVSQAMITTAAGLVVAIPAMAIYFLLRGRVIRIIAEVEAQSSEFIELLAEENRK